MKYRNACAMAALLVGLGLSWGAGAQVLSSPMGDQPIASGQGPGVHGANSTFPPLVPRADIVPWSVLTDVSVKFQKPRVITTFPEKVKKLNGTKVKVQGYMTPIEPGATHTHFLLLSVPPTCPFCMPGGAESMIEVRTSKALKYTENAIVIQGELQVLENDSQGLYYRMTGARAVK
jgi:hypothetical protein